jgi:hypothetical protein
VGHNHLVAVAVHSLAVGVAVHSQDALVADSQVVGHSHPPETEEATDTQAVGHSLARDEAGHPEDYTPAEQPLEAADKGGVAWHQVADNHPLPVGGVGRKQALGQIALVGDNWVAQRGVQGAHWLGQTHLRLAVPPHGRGTGS